MKHIPRKRFGQNFLTDQSVLDNIIRAINPQRDDLMVEIGPGLGAMTRLLLASLAHLHAVEVDRDLARHLEQTIDRNKLSVHQHDALQFDFSELMNAQKEGQNKKLRVVGNLPYNISSPLLFHLTQFVPQIQDQHFMLQKEVVERMVAEPGGKAYGRLSVMLQWRYHMDLLFIVPPEAFDPPPQVDSAIVRMIPIAHPMDCDAAALERVVTKAFSQRRKVIRNCLSGMFAENELIDAGVDSQARPEAVPLEQFVALANHLKARSA